MQKSPWLMAEQRKVHLCGIVVPENKIPQCSNEMCEEKPNPKYESFAKIQGFSLTQSSKWLQGHYN